MKRIETYRCILIFFLMIISLLFPSVALLPSFEMWEIGFATVCMVSIYWFHLFSALVYSPSIPVRVMPCLVVSS